MTQHTQGEWIRDPNDKDAIAVIVDNENGDGVCEISGRGEEANARLIVASPRLLAFAKLVAAGNLTREGFIDAANRVLESAGV